jgi:hypothetical protein
MLLATQFGRILVTSARNSIGSSTAVLYATLTD